MRIVLPVIKLTLNNVCATEPGKIITANAIENYFKLDD